jgi:hypothetical protein
VHAVVMAAQRRLWVAMVYAFIACQLYVVLFIALHDWIPLGRLSNRAGIRSADTTARLLRVTALSTLPYAIGLGGSVYYASSRFPDWLMWLLWISYGAGVYGMLRAWWVPYLLVPDPVRAARYQQRFRDTHAFLPMREWHQARYVAREFPRPLSYLPGTPCIPDFCRASVGRALGARCNHRSS